VFTHTLESYIMNTVTHVKMDKQSKSYTHWNSLYRVGGGAAMAMAVLIPIQSPGIPLTGSRKFLL